MHSWCKIQKQGLRHPWKGMVMSHELNLLSLWSLLVRFFFSWLFLIWSMHHRSSTRLLGAKRLTQKNTYVYVYVYVYIYIYYPEGNPKLDPPENSFRSFPGFPSSFICKRRCFSVRWAGVQPSWTNVTFAQPAQCMELSCCRRCVAFNGALGASRQYQQHKCDTSWPFTLQVMFFPVLRRTTDDDPLGRPFAAVGVKSRGWGELRRRNIRNSLGCQECGFFQELDFFLLVWLFCFWRFVGLKCHLSLMWDALY